MVPSFVSELSELTVVEEMLIARVAPQMSVHTLKLGEKGLRKYNTF